MGLQLSMGRVVTRTRSPGGGVPSTADTGPPLAAPAVPLKVNIACSVGLRRRAAIPPLARTGDLPSPPSGPRGPLPLMGLRRSPMA